VAGWSWSHWGSYSRRCEPRVIPRFRCGHCRSAFSSQTFSTTYYLKRPELLEPAFQRVIACSGYRQIAREAKCDPTSIMGQTARLGRHALLFLHANRPTKPLTEPVVIDGFESFAFSQYHPLHLNLAVGDPSHFTYGFTLAELRRKGRMTSAQRRRRTWIEREFGRPSPKAVEDGMVDLMRLAARGATEVTARSDEHPAYPRAFRRLTGCAVHHECTPSVQARTPKNPLFPVNLIDLLLRHNSANHKRETIAFSKRHQSVIERAAILILWRNYMKQFSERNGGGTPAMRIGIRERPLTVKEVLKDRLFPTHVRLPQPWADYYLRKVPTRRIRNPRLHTLKRAF
jgi:hypothetical protein